MHTVTLIEYIVNICQSNSFCSYINERLDML